MSPSRHRAPRVGACLTAAALVVTFAAFVPTVSGSNPGLEAGSADAVVQPAAPLPESPVEHIPLYRLVLRNAVPGPSWTTDGSPLGSPGVLPGQVLRYRLVVRGLNLDGMLASPIQVGLDEPSSPHTSYTLISDACGACHRPHEAQGLRLQSLSPPQADLCLTCHDGTGSVLDVRATFANPAVPANDPVTSSFYAHPALVDLGHLPGVAGEFQGQLDRHATCTDCHDPHRADGTLAVPGSAGWSASGALIGASGVSVANGPAGTAPTYALTRNVTLEYQLCFRCHSGWTELPAQDPSRPSTWALDKGIELNPASGSFHPIEAGGRNGTAAMAASLDGGTLWQFEVGSTIRCVNCHGDASKVAPGLVPGARLAPHASTERGLLIAPYRDRLLKPAGEAYLGADFTLCYLCHAETPFTATESGATNFDLHATHMTGIGALGGGGTNIDVAGAGQGNATCAECHFRLHSTALAVKPGDVNNARLVNFAPNVLPRGSTLEWTGTSSQSCTLTCHGVSHRAAGYEPAAVQNAALGVDARISIASGGANLVGQSHAFTVTVEKNDGSGYGPAAGIAVTVTEDGVGSIDADASTCDDSLTNGSGQCIVVLTSSALGASAVNATATVSVEGVVGPVIVGVSTTGHGAFVVSNTTTWVDARITIGTSGTSPVNVPYTFTVTIELNDGSGWAPAVGIAVGPTLSVGVGAITGGTCDNAAPDTDAAGACTVIVESSEVGASTVDAAATVVVGGLAIQVSTAGYGAYGIGNVVTWEPAP